jgi:uncharacterized protein (DUF983 family)
MIQDDDQHTWLWRAFLALPDVLSDMRIAGVAGTLEHCFHNGMFRTLEQVMQFCVRCDTNPEKSIPANTPAPSKSTTICCPNIAQM